MALCKYKCLSEEKDKKMKMKWKLQRLLRQRRLLLLLVGSKTVSWNSQKKKANETNIKKKQNQGRKVRMNG